MRAWDFLKWPPLVDLRQNNAMVSTPRPKVAHMTSVHAATDPRIVFKECATLASAGYDVVLIAPEPPAEVPAGVRHRTVPFPRNRFERFTKTNREVLRAALEERADVYHFHDPELIWIGAVLRMRGAHVIFDVHEDIPLDIRTKPWIPPALRPGVSAVAGFVLRIMQRFFTAIVPATTSIAQTFTHRRTVVVRNYPRLEELAPADGDVPIERRPMTALYLGSVTAIRGVEQMVDAMAHPMMPQGARLLLAGPFEDDALRRRLETLNGWAHVDAPGRLAQREVPRVLARSRMGLLVLQPAASFERALPTKLFEYMACGLPVIVADFLECVQIVERFECGIVVDPRDSNQIALAMCRLFNNPQEARAMGERGRVAALDRYAWSNEARTLVGLYREIAS